MKISGLKKRSSKDEIVTILLIVSLFVLAIWFVSPPRNKALQLCYWGFKVKAFYLKKTRNIDIEQYRYHVNNAIYLVKLYRNEPWNIRRALTEMDLAEQAFPKEEPKQKLSALYKKRAEIKLIAEDYKGALVDYMLAGDLGYYDTLKVGILYTKLGKFEEADKICNEIIQKDASSHSSFACLANVYIQQERLEDALRLYNMSVSRDSKNAQAYVDRAKLKKMMGNEIGYKADMVMAQELYPQIKEEVSYIDTFITPNISDLEFQKY